ncbi:hypothetical protein [Paracoccus aminovorans]|uniref:hypothetical protein n=1 Tax=Paracoccus aminovorans TaxID=34004 RepID=UPI002B2640EC|nr:hypothetical protein [Paracoccus aminovorans]
MTAPEAAQVRGVGRNCAYTWSARAKVKWPKPPSAMRCPVRIRGVDYPSMEAAARALRVHQSNICRHLALYGHADNVGLRKSGGQIGNRARHLENPIKIGSREWHSRKALANYIGWSQSKVVRAFGRQGSDAMRDRVLAAVMAEDARRAQHAAHRRSDQDQGGGGRTARPPFVASAAFFGTGSPERTPTRMPSC